MSHCREKRVGWRRRQPAIQCFVIRGLRFYCPVDFCKRLHSSCSKHAPGPHRMTFESDILPPEEDCYSRCVFRSSNSPSAPKSIRYSTTICIQSHQNSTEQAAPPALGVCIPTWAISDSKWGMRGVSHIWVLFSTMAHCDQKSPRTIPIEQVQRPFSLFGWETMQWYPGVAS